MYGIEQVLEAVFAKWLTLLIIGSIIGLVVMYLVSKLTGSVRFGGIVAAVVLSLSFYWSVIEGHFLQFLSNIN